MPILTTGALLEKLKFREPYSTFEIVVSNPFVVFDLPESRVFENGTFVVVFEVDRNPAVVEVHKNALPFSKPVAILPRHLAIQFAQNVCSIDSQVFVLVDRADFSRNLSRHCATSWREGKDATLEQTTATDVAPYRCPMPLPMSIAIMTRPER